MYGLGKNLLIGTVIGLLTFNATIAFTSRFPVEIFRKIGSYTELDIRVGNICSKSKCKHQFQKIELHKSCPGDI
jgi:hypothetical protein